MNLKDKHKEEEYWKIINSDKCAHTYFGHGFAVRRSYLLSGENHSPLISAVMGLILSSAFYIIHVDIPFSKIKNTDLKIYY
jgi:hypothetical protein